MSPSLNTIAIGMITVLIAVIVYDIYLGRDEVRGNTYSEILRAWFRRWSWLYYLVAFAFGVLMAHWGAR